MAKSTSRKAQKHSFGVTGISLAIVALIAVALAGYAIRMNIDKENTTVSSTDADSTVKFQAPTDEQLEYLKKSTNSF